MKKRYKLTPRDKEKLQQKIKAGVRLLTKNRVLASLGEEANNRLNYVLAYRVEEHKNFTWMKHNGSAEIAGIMPGEVFGIDMNPFQGRYYIKTLCGMVDLDVITAVKLTSVSLTDNTAYKRAFVYADPFRPFRNFTPRRVNSSEQDKRIKLGNPVSKSWDSLKTTTDDTPNHVSVKETATINQPDGDHGAVEGEEMDRMAPDGPFIQIQRKPRTTKTGKIIRRMGRI